MSGKFNQALFDLLPKLPVGFRWQYSYDKDTEKGSLSIQLDASDGWWYGSQGSFPLNKNSLGSEEENRLVLSLAHQLVEQQFPDPPPQSKLIGVTRV